MQDYITILTSSDDRGNPRGFWAKRVTARGVKENNFPYLNTSRAVAAGGIHDLAAILDGLADRPHSCIIRARKREGAPQVHNRKYLPGKNDRGDDVEPAFEPKPCSWFCLDVDKLPLSDIGCGPETLPPVLPRNIIKTCLPSAFQGVTYYWQLSSSHGRQGKKSNADVPAVSAHLWFWLDRPCSEKDLKRYVQYLNYAARMELGIRSEKDVFDDKLYNPVQPHFTADPVLDPGIESLPYSLRGLDRFDEHVVRITPELDLEPGAWQRHLARIGDGKGGFRDPILQAIGAYVHEHGSIALEHGPRSEVKAAIRQAIDLADPGLRSSEQIERYRDDDWLDRAFEGAAGKGYGKAGADQAAAAAGLGYLWVRDLSKYYHKKNRVFQSADGVRLEYRSQKDVTRNKHFLENIQQVDRVQSIPGKQDCLVIDEGQTVWSNWPGRKVEATYGDVGWFLEHINFICTDTPEAEPPLLDWVANLLGNPGNRALWAPVIGSTHGGIGKTMITDLLDALLYGVKPLTDNDLTEKYKDYADTELATCAEVKLGARLNATELLKSIISDAKMHIRRFGKPHVVMTLHCHHFFTTNYRDAMPLQQGGDRRYLVIWNDQRPKEREYYIKLGRHIEEDAGDVLGWAIERCRAMEFDRHAAPPVTGHALVMAELARPADEQVITEAMRERVAPFDFRVAFAQEVYPLVGRLLQVRPPGPQKLADLLCRNGGSYLRINGYDENERRTKRTVYIIDDGSEGLAGKPEKELFELAVTESRRRADRAKEARIKEAAETEIAKVQALRLVKEIG